MALLKWNAKALEASKPKVQRQVLAIAAEDQSPHFMGPENIQYPTADRSGNLGVRFALCSEKRYKRNDWMKTNMNLEPGFDFRLPDFVEPQWQVSNGGNNFYFAKTVRIS